MFDLHVHTPFSDGQHDMDTILTLLIDLGIKIVGFADHVFPFAIYKHSRKSNMNPKGLVNNWSAKQLIYRKDVFEFYDKKYPKIHILNGAEIDIYPNGVLSLPPGISKDFFDYLMIAKHHTLPLPLKFLYKRTPKVECWMWKYNPRLRLNTYLWEKGLYEAFRRWNPIIFAHPQDGMPKCISRNRMKRFVLYCKKHDVALELNNFKDVMPYRMMLEYGHEYGVKFSLGSDFHGYKTNIRELMNKSQEMYNLVEKYDLLLLNPYNLMST